jgi:peptidoglycan/xylan/chitin deacetylase (PgdA/CDA1 family)
MENTKFQYEFVSALVLDWSFPYFGKMLGITVLPVYYHMVSDDDNIAHVKHLFKYKCIREFKDDLDFLLKRYTPVTLKELILFFKEGRKLPDNAVLLTFDDGFREISDIVAPILLEKGFTATFFVNSGFIDNKELCYQHKGSILVEHLMNCKAERALLEKIDSVLLQNEIHGNEIKSRILSISYQKKHLMDTLAAIMDVDFSEYIQKHKPYLSSEQIKGLINGGFSIGAHSVDHPLYANLSIEDQLYQTVESITQIRNQFCLDYGAFAFPHSDYNVSQSFFERLFETGLVDVSFGTGGLIKDSFPGNMQRLSLERPLLPAKKNIAYQLSRSVWKALIKADIIKRS